MSENDNSMNSSADERRRMLIEAARRQIASDDASARGKSDSSAEVPNPSPQGSSEVKIADTTFSLPPRDSISGYKIVREIHRGAQGVVYQAVQNSTKRKVAIKVMKEGPFAGHDERARFDREIRILGRLNHTNIVTIHDTGEAAGSQYIVMDYISGHPLDVYMGREPRNTEKVLRLFANICKAVDSAHLRGIIHRDLKPSNIRIDQEGEPHILDFGLAKSAGDADASMATMTGRFLGTPAWASPEQADGQPGNIDIRSDVYSLGVILYQMLTGQFPYSVTGSTQAVLDRIRRTEPLRPRTLSRNIDDEVETIVLKCLHKERERRYQSAGELARDVDRYLAGDPIDAKRDSLAYMFGKQLRRYKPQATIAASFFVLILIGLAVSMLLWQQADAARRDAVVSQEHASTSADRERAINSLFSDMLTSVAVGREDSTAITVIEMLAEAEDKLERQPPNDALVEAAVRQSIGVAYRALDDYDGATRQIQGALALRRDALGDRHPDVSDSLHELAKTALVQKDLKSAESLCREALSIRRDTLGETDPAVAETLNSLGMILKNQRNFIEAESVLRDALSILSPVRLGAEYAVLTADMKSNLAGALKNQGRYEEAEALYHDAIATFRRVDDKNLYRIATCLNNLGLSLASHGENDEAERSFRDALEMRKKLYGEGHSSVGTGYHNLAAFLDRTGKLQEAADCYRLAIEIRDSHAARGNVKVIHSRVKYAAFLLKNGDTESAESQARDALTLSQEFDYQWGIVYASLLLGKSWNLNGKAADAAPLLRELLSLVQEMTGLKPLIAERVQTELGRSLVMLKQFGEAEAVLKHSLTRIQGAESTNNEPLLEYTLECLVELYETSDDAAAASPYVAMLDAISAQ